MNEQIGSSIKGHVLKFRGDQLVNRGKKCNPERMFGVGKQSPAHFYGNQTLVVENSYIHKDRQTPALSQKKYIDIGYNTKPGNFQQDHKTLSFHSNSFHHRKGLLSEFLDKNKIMIEVTPVTGIQRSYERIDHTRKALRDKMAATGLSFKSDSSHYEKVNMFVIKSKMRSTRKKMALQSSDCKTQKLESAKSTFYEGFSRTRKGFKLQYD